VARIAAQLGRKNFRNDRPEERLDTKVLEVLIDLDPGARLPIGLPVDVIFDTAPAVYGEAELSDMRVSSADFRTATIR